MRTPLTRSLLVSLGAAALLLGASGAFARETTPVAIAFGQSEDGGDQQRGTTGADLLEIAFDAASAIAVDPHVKERSKAQESVVQACLALDQPRRALWYSNQILNWRRGGAYADIAYHQLERGRTAWVEPLIALALSVADTTEDWRRDRIRVKVARVHAALGATDTAALLEADVVPAEMGKVQGVLASLASDHEFDQQLRTIEEAAATGDFDRARNAIDAGVSLYRRFGHDAARRSRVEATIRATWTALPPMIRIDALCRLAEAAIEADDRATALSFADEADALLATPVVDAEHRIQLMARVAEQRGRAGDVADARRQLASAADLYDSRRDEIIDMFRAATLRPLAEAHHALGDGPAALEMYRRVVEAGVENVNSRPRALDLAATCASMARVGFEPDPALRARILDIRAGLGPPW